MTVVAPGDPLEAEMATLAMIESPGPHYLRLGRAGESTVYPTEITFELGKAVTVREGDDVTIISTGAMLSSALEVADRLASESVRARLLSMHTLSPIDSDSVIKAARETRVLVTVEEHSVVGGLGGAVAEILAEAGLPGVVFKRIGLPHQFCSVCGSQDYLLAESGMSPERIKGLITTILQGANRPSVHPESI